MIASIVVAVFFILVIGVPVVVDLLYPLWRDGCWHDWEILDRRSWSWCREEAEGSVHHSFLSSVEDLRFVRKVCLNCGKIEDQIAAEIVKQRAEIKEHNQRQMLAEELAVADGRMTLCPECKLPRPKADTGRCFRCVSRRVAEVAAERTTGHV